MFKEAIAETVKFTEESTKLGEALGISAGQASVLREALEQGNTSQDEFVTAAKGLLKQVRENESGLNDMGLKTRDAAGQLRPLNDLTMDAIQVLNGYRAAVQAVKARSVEHAPPDAVPAAVLSAAGRRLLPDGRLSRAPARSAPSPPTDARATTTGPTKTSATATNAGGAA